MLATFALAAAIVVAATMWYLGCMTSLKNARRCECMHDVNFNATVLPTQPRVIPRQILQLTKRMDSLPEYMCELSKKLRRMNEGHDYHLMDDEDCRRYLRKHFASEPDVLKAFNQVKAGAYRADVFRYAWLWKEGGVYIDMGLRPMVPFDDMFGTTDELIVVHESPNYYPLWFNDKRVKPGLYQAFLACAKGNEGMRAMLDLCVSNILNRRYGLTALYPTGPVCAW